MAARIGGGGSPLSVRVVGGSVWPARASVHGEQGPGPSAHEKIGTSRRLQSFLRVAIQKGPANHELDRRNPASWGRSTF